VIIFICYLLVGLVLGQLGALSRARAWARPYKQEIKESWSLYILFSPFWILCLGEWFLHDTPLTRGEITKEELAKTWSKS